MERKRSSERRVVVTGVGMVTSLGMNSKESFRNLLNGDSGIRALPFDHETVNMSGSILNFNAKEELKGVIHPKTFKYYSYAALLAEKAAHEAMLESGFITPDGSVDSDIDNERAAVFIATGVGGEFDVDPENPKEDWKPRDSEAMNIFKVLPGQVGSPIARRLDLQGSAFTPVAECNSGTEAIIAATKEILLDDADVVVAGGTEAAIAPRIINYFDNIDALSHNTFAMRPSYPFDAYRSGFHMADGAGVVIVEELSHAIKRGATPLAEIVGYGSSSDGAAANPTRTNGKGIERAMRKARKDINDLSNEEVIFLSAHATATPVGDGPEAQAIANVFADVDGLYVHAAKGNRGHACGASGAIAMSEMVRALQEGVLPPNKYNELMEGIEFNLPREAYNLQANYAFINSSGFGGVNGSIAIKRFEE